MSAQIFTEKHWPSAGVWAFSLLMSVSVGVAVGAATSTTVGVLLVVAVQALQSWMLAKAAFGIEVSQSQVRVGPATLPRWAIADVCTLNRSELRAALGIHANPAAWLMVRPWTKSAVKISIHDVHDPHPYWIVGTRHGAQFAQALTSRH